MTLSERNEASTRAELIDTQLARAGWSRNRRTLIEEFLLKAAEPDSAYGNDQFADYVLLGSDSQPIAVVEAIGSRGQRSCIYLQCEAGRNQNHRPSSPTQS